MEVKVRISRLQAWRFKLGVKIIKLGISLAGEKNSHLLKSSIDLINQSKASSNIKSE